MTLQANGWHEQDQTCSAADIHKAGHELARITRSTYNPKTGQFTKNTNKKPKKQHQHPKKGQ